MAAKANRSALNISLHMMQLHATIKLMSRLPVDASGCLPATPRSQWLFEQPVLDVNPLSGWQGHYFTLQRRNCVLLVHEHTRFPVFMPNLLKQDFNEFNERFVDSFMNTLLKCGADEALMDTAQRYLRPFQVDTKSNRSALGTLNVMRADTEHMLSYEYANIAEMTGYRIGAWLADRPCSAKGRGFMWPQREMLTLLAALADCGSGVPGAGQGSEAPAELPGNVVSLDAFRRGR